MKKIDEQLLQSFIAYHEDDINAYLNGDLTTDDFIDNVYNAETNFNNADTTSGQRVYEQYEIEKMLSQAVIKLRKNDDRCSNCGKLIEDEEWLFKKYKTIYECIGYRCLGCYEVEVR